VTEFSTDLAAGAKTQEAGAALANPLSTGRGRQF
jgi:hypothetical protein